MGGKPDAHIMGGLIVDCKKIRIEQIQSDYWDIRKNSAVLNTSGFKDLSLHNNTTMVTPGSIFSLVQGFKLQMVHYSAD